MVKNILAIILAAVLLWGCNGGSSSDEGVILKGTLTKSSDGQMIYLDQLSPDKRIPMDSTTVKNGEFIFQFKPKGINFYVLRFTEQNFVTLIIDSTEHIVFKADARDLPSSYSVEGSPGSDLVRQINLKLKSTYIKIDSLQQLVQEMQKDPKFNKKKPGVDSAFVNIFLEHRSWMIQFVKKNVASMACLVALYQECGRTPVFDTQNDYDLYVKVDSALMSKYPNSEHSIALHKQVIDLKKTMEERIKQEKMLGIGSVAPDISLPNPKGDIISLSSFRGKYVLIDFWAAWCKPCRMESPNMVKLYKKFKPKGFEIFSVSLDKEKASWEAAIKQDKLTWTHVSDLGYWSSSVVKQYNIESIPMTVLLDKEGKIVAKNLRGEELEKAVQSLIK
jgi:peroxiredoxin